MCASTRHSRHYSFLICPSTRIKRIMLLHTYSSPFRLAYVTQSGAKLWTNKKIFFFYFLIYFKISISNIFHCKFAIKVLCQSNYLSYFFCAHNKFLSTLIQLLINILKISNHNHLPTALLSLVCFQINISMNLSKSY